MPAPEKNRLSASEQSCYGLLAGGGALPLRVASMLRARGDDVFVVGFDGQTDPAIYDSFAHMRTRLGAAGSVIETLRARCITDLLLIGAIRRPSLAELRPDLRTAGFFARLGLRALGDDGLLRAIRDELEADGFQIHGVHKILPELLVPEGRVGRYEPAREDWPGIKRAVDTALALGHYDVGQGVIVQQGHILSVEGAEGTDEMIRRTKPLLRKGRGGVLVKLCKPDQDQDMDLPTIGPETARIAAAHGLTGIVAHAGRSLMVDSAEMVSVADSHKIFIYGCDPEKVRHDASKS